MTVLIVGGLAPAARAIQRMLRGSGLATEHVATKSVALRRIAREKSWRAFVIEARIERGNDGLEVLEHVAAAFPTTPRVVVSDVVDPSVINRAGRAGASYICKPIQVDDLARLISQALSTCIGDVELRAHVVAWGRRAKLTAKEQEVLASNIATKLSRSACRVALNVSEKTLAAHHRAILSKAAIHGDASIDMSALVISLLLGARAARRT